MKKGSIIDVFLIPILLLVLAFVFFMIFTISDSLNTELQASDLSTEAKQVIDQGNEAVKLADFWFLFVAAGFFLGAVISGYLTPSHPVFLGVILIFIALSVFLSGSWSNVYETFSQNPSMATALAEFDMTNALMIDLPIYVGIVGIGTAAVMYGFRRDKGVRTY